MVMLRVESIDKLPEFKGAIRGITHDKYHTQVCVIDHGCAEVSVVCVETFFSTTLYLNLLQTIKSQKFLLKMVNEFVASEELIRQIWTITDRKAKQNIVNETDKFLIFYDEIISAAVNLSASDIHFEMLDQEESLIRLRVYGRVIEWKRVSTELLKGALTAAYSKRTKTGTNSSGALSLDRAMNTMTEQVVNGKIYNGRFTGYPVVNGYDVVMRLLESDPRSKIPDIQALGYASYHVQDQIMPAIRKNAGMMAIAGSTGSGKSTALRSFIYALPGRDQLKIYGVEDPVEYLNRFMRQISVQRNTDDPDDVVKMKFLSALRSVLRMDPDVLMLGEIRDRDSASLASEFNRTGHRVFTTVHGDGCVDVLARLCSEEIGISPSTLAGKKYLTAVMYQKLLPKVCTHCRIPAVDVLPKATLSVLIENFKVNPQSMFCASETGCEHCRLKLGSAATQNSALQSQPNIAGTKGMTVVAEILIPDDEILDAIKKRDWQRVEDQWRGARNSGFDSEDMRGKTAFEHALYKACAGLIDPRDIESDFESFETYRIREIDRQPPQLVDQALLNSSMINANGSKPAYLLKISKDVETVRVSNSDAEVA